METSFLILVGFDRSGTSFCSQLLAEHPRIECFIQPFSSTVVHETEWAYWPPDESYPEVEQFMNSLLDGRVERSFLQSDWFDNHSSTQTVEEGKLHVIKSTKLHHKIDWFRHHFPDVEIWGIHRNLKGILCSLFRNSFYEKWYGEEEVTRFRQHLSSFNYPHQFVEEVQRANSGLEKMTCMATGRIWSMYQALSSDQILSYEKLVNNPDQELSKILDESSLKTIDFSPYLKKNYNIVGKETEGVHYWQTYFSKDELRTIDRISSTLSVQNKK